MTPEWGRYDQAKADADIAVHAALTTGVHGVGAGVVVGTTLTQALTNKTLTSPVIQGTVTPGTGLTMPAFTAGGDITLGANKIIATTDGLFGSSDVWLQPRDTTTMDIRGAAANLDVRVRTLFSTESQDSAAVANIVALGSYELSADHRALSIGCEEAVISEAVVSDRTLQVRINGVTYKFCLKA